MISNITINSIICKSYRRNPYYWLILKDPLNGNEGIWKLKLLSLDKYLSKKFFQKDYHQLTTADELSYINQSSSFFSFEDLDMDFFDHDEKDIDFIKDMCEYKFDLKQISKEDIEDEWNKGNNSSYSEYEYEKISDALKRINRNKIIDNL